MLVPDPFRELVLGSGDHSGATVALDGESISVQCSTQVFHGQDMQQIPSRMW